MIHRRKNNTLTVQNLHICQQKRLAIVLTLLYNTDLWNHIKNYIALEKSSTNFHQLANMNLQLPGLSGCRKQLSEYSAVIKPIKLMKLIK